MKLMVKYGNSKSKKYGPFHPELRLRNTGYARGHWQEMHFRPGCFVGSSTIREKTLPEAIAQYFSELRRMGHVEVKQ